MMPFELALPPAETTVHVAPTPGRPLALTFSVRDMRFERGGNNLYISSPDGAELILLEYFTHAGNAPFCTNTGGLIAGADFLRIMNPEMDVTLFGSKPASRARRFSIFNTPNASWDRLFFCSLAAEDDEQRYAYHADGADGPVGPIGQDTEGRYAGSDASASDIRCDETGIGDGGEDSQTWSFIRSLQGSVTLAITAKPGSGAMAFLAYVALFGEDAPANDCYRLDDEQGSTLFQDSLMGRTSTTLVRQAEADLLILAAESFHTFRACYGDWLKANILFVDAREVHIFLNAPDSRTRVDFEEYFGGDPFSQVPITQVYEEGQGAKIRLDEDADSTLTRADLACLVDTTSETDCGLFDDPSAKQDAEEEAERLRVEHLVLVDPETNAALSLQGAWDAETEAQPAIPATSAINLDEQSLLLEPGKHGA